MKQENEFILEKADLTLIPCGVGHSLVFSRCPEASEVRLANMAPYSTSEVRLAKFTVGPSSHESILAWTPQSQLSLLSASMTHANSE